MSEHAFDVVSDVSDIVSDTSSREEQVELCVRLVFGVSAHGVRLSARSAPQEREESFVSGTNSGLFNLQRPGAAVGCFPAASGLHSYDIELKTPCAALTQLWKGRVS